MKNKNSTIRYAIRIMLLIIQFCFGILFSDGRVQVFAQDADKSGIDWLAEGFSELLSGEPVEIARLRELSVADSDEGHYEYYFNQLNDSEKRCYREILNGVRNFESEFYLSFSDDDIINRSYHAVTLDHPEIFWIHNREKVYKTTYSRGDYCLFEPGYTHIGEEYDEICQSMEAAYEEIKALLPEGAQEYDIAKTVYTYLIEQVTYIPSEDDQSLAGSLWKKEAVCAGYAGAFQYLMERFGIYCIYVEGNSLNNDEGHAWNIIMLDEEFYYVDVTNGDQPDFLEGDAKYLEEHKTIIYDYLCPFPEEYEKTYQAIQDFPLPQCTSVTCNFYVMNLGCIYEYNWEDVLEYCRMRIDNGAAVVRFKCFDQDVYEALKTDWVDGDSMKEVAQYYMQQHELEEIEYHFGVLDNLYTVYYMF
ncbi:MAG: transglutaminase-like superfamily [Blautia sp.]|nr:transglutaminase-like superfamily [Blautia sp.]